MAVTSRCPGLRHPAPMIAAGVAAAACAGAASNTSTSAAPAASVQATAASPRLFIALRRCRCRRTPAAGASSPILRAACTAMAAAGAVVAICVGRCTDVCRCVCSSVRQSRRRLRISHRCLPSFMRHARINTPHSMHALHVFDQSIDRSNKRLCAVWVRVQAILHIATLQSIDPVPRAGWHHHHQTIPPVWRAHQRAPHRGAPFDSCISRKACSMTPHSHQHKRRPTTIPNPQTSQPATCKHHPTRRQRGRLNRRNGVKSEVVRGVLCVTPPPCPEGLACFDALWCLRAGCVN